MSIFVERLGLIIAENIQTGAGNNINGPCCIEVPSWCVGHEAGGAGKRHMKNASLGRGRTLYQEELYQNYWHTVVHLHCGETFEQRR